MKIRNGFVSNSSSSSYIIAFDGLDRSDLKKLFCGGANTGVDAVGIQEVVDSMKKWYGIGEAGEWWDPEDAEEERQYKRQYNHDQFVCFAGVISRLAKVVENGDDVALICISRDDNNSHDNLNSRAVRIVESFD